MRAIYALTTTDSLEARYVGKSVAVETRLRKHLQEASKPCNQHRWKNRWINTVLAKGEQPILRVVEANVADIDTAEKKWIAYFRAEGHRLTNATDGGDGTCGHKMSMETRQKIRAASLAHRHSEETKEKLRNRDFTEEWRMKIKAARAKQGPTRFGGVPPLTPEKEAERRMKIGAARKGKKISQEQKERHSALMKAKMQLPEVRAMYDQIRYKWKPGQAPNNSEAKAAGYKKWIEQGNRPSLSPEGRERVNAALRTAAQARNETLKKPTVCRRCGELQPSVRAAISHDCRLTLPQGYRKNPDNPRWKKQKDLPAYDSPPRVPGV